MVLTVALITLTAALLGLAGVLMNIRKNQQPENQIAIPIAIGPDELDDSVSSDAIEQVSDDLEHVYRRFYKPNTPVESFLSIVNQELLDETGTHQGFVDLIVASLDRKLEKYRVATTNANDREVRAESSAPEPSTIFSSALRFLPDEIMKEFDAPEVIETAQDQVEVARNYGKSRRQVKVSQVWDMALTVFRVRVFKFTKSKRWSVWK